MATDDRAEMQAARDAGLKQRHETREARAIRRQVAEEIPEVVKQCWLCLGHGGIAPHMKWSEQRGKPLWTAHEHPSNDPHPTYPCPACSTFTASEVKELTTKATEVALALGRKEALEAAASRLMAERATPGRHYSPQAMAAYGMAASIVREMASHPSQAASEPLTAPTGHSDLPPTLEAAKDPHGIVDLVGRLRDAVDVARKRRLADLPEGRDQ